MENLTDCPYSWKIILPFNPKPPTILHIDLNSCFATIEQQANPKLRGKPIAVAAYTTPSGCIIAPSIEAKKIGIKVGMRVKDGKMLCPSLIVLTPDPQKYRTIHLSIKELLNQYSSDTTPKSIDEFVVNLEGFPAFKKGIKTVAQEIKNRIKSEIGDFLTVSIGIGPNRFLAKTGAGLHKPDGLDVIDGNTYETIYKSLELTDLCGIKFQNGFRLQSQGIFSVWDFYNAPIWKLKAAFESALGYYWYIRLHGFEIDDIEFGRKSYGNSYALPKPLSQPSELAPILQKLTVKTGQRLRKAGYHAKGVHLALLYRDNSFWHKGVTLPNYIFDSRDIFGFCYDLLVHSPYKKPVRTIAESCFSLKRTEFTQMSLLDDVLDKERLCKAVDTINERWGDYVITPGLMMGMEKEIVDRVAFGGVKELEEIVIH